MEIFTSWGAAVPREGEVLRLGRCESKSPQPHPFPSLCGFSPPHPVDRAIKGLYIWPLGVNAKLSCRGAIPSGKEPLSPQVCTGRGGHRSEGLHVSSPLSGPVLPPHFCSHDAQPCMSPARLSAFEAHRGHTRLCPAGSSFFIGGGSLCYSFHPPIPSFPHQG